MLSLRIPSRKALAEPGQAGRKSVGRPLARIPARDRYNDEARENLFSPASGLACMPPGNRLRTRRVLRGRPIGPCTGRPMHLSG